MTEFDQKRFIAAKFLRDNLAGGPLDAKIMQERAKANGISEPTLRRAKPEAGVISRRVSNDGEARWEWLLQDAQPATQAVQGDQTQDAHAQIGPIAAAQDAHGPTQGGHPVDSPGAQDAQSEASQGAEVQGAQGEALQDAQPPVRRKRHVIVRRKGVEAVGDDELSWTEFESLGCDLSRVPDYVRQRDAERKTTNVEAA
jgi:hypothetical protein